MATSKAVSMGAWQSYVSSAERSFSGVLCERGGRRTSVVEISLRESVSLAPRRRRRKDVP